MKDSLLKRLLARKSADAGGCERFTQREIDKLVSAVSDLSERLNLERSIVLERYLDEPTLLAGYAAFYLPRSIHQIRSVLGEIGRPPRRVIDAGSGPGSATLAALDQGAEHVLALDYSRAALELLDDCTDSRVSTEQVDLESHDIAESVASFEADTVITSHVLNELWTRDNPVERRAQWCLRILDALPEDGRLVVVDPALKETSRSLMAVRDAVVAGGGAVVAPCLRQGSCPALIDQRDWCHAERPWQPSPLVESIAERVGVRHDVAKMTYFVFASSAARHRANRYRIVSEPLHTKGRLRYFGCGRPGRRSLILKERDATGDAAIFADLARGDIVAIGETVEKGDGFVVQSGEPVELISRAGEPPPSKEQ